MDLAIGSPGNLFRLIIDTGSGCTLLNDTRCQTSNCLKRKGYDASHIPPELNREPVRDFDIKYAQGEVIMEIVRDYFFLGKTRVPQEFGLILFEDRIFERASFDGIMGLSYPELSQSTLPFFDTLIDQGVLERNVFSIYLERRTLSPEEKKKGDDLEVSAEAESSHPGETSNATGPGDQEISDTQGFLANLESIFKQNSALLDPAPSSSKQLASTKVQTSTHPRKKGKVKLSKAESPKSKGHSGKKVGKEKSALILGGWDNSLFSGELHFHPVVRKSWWTLTLDQVLLDGEDTGLCGT